MLKFISGRFMGAVYALRGAFHLLKTEDAIQFQTLIAMVFMAAGFYFEISSIEWMIQLLAIGLVMATEAMNTAVEKVADFIHPDNHKDIGLIKDVSAGAVFIAAVFSLAAAAFIYLPKILG